MQLLGTYFFSQLLQPALQGVMGHVWRLLNACAPLFQSALVAGGAEGSGFESTLELEEYPLDLEGLISQVRTPRATAGGLPF